eukprot:CAMPEP_0117754714 /NCGR_PEP_ID=MMETSP0947-20121206/12988_1 /TAXON_ID=44440 /ORGANISM="Chattonella subsalsa, Strain CCMP2191" /LENGTH=226 /DNA_ID=CAMNT_0005573845 /DNA_START=47 /DNA_END=727 /DNA_ORIENTATION=-
MTSSRRSFLLEVPIITALTSSSLGNRARAAGGQYETAVFAGGCFWCMEPPFDKLGPGVVATTSGYCGGREENPTYEQVSLGKTGHAEAVQVMYDPNKVSYETLLDVFWHNVDPTTSDREFCDKGRQYRTAIFFKDDFQKEAALKSKQKYEKLGVFGGPIVTEIVPVTPFWNAEPIHQDFYLTNTKKYKYYRNLCGRDVYLYKTWGMESLDYLLEENKAKILMMNGQ